MASEKRSSGQVDSLLLILIIGLSLFGLMMIASSSAVIAERFRGDSFYFFKHQLIYGGATGLAALLAGVFIPYWHWKKFALPAMALSIVLLILVFIPSLQVEAGGAARWIGLGPITLQPSEVTKLAFIIYLAALLESKSDRVRSFKEGVLPFLTIMSVIGFLIIMQPDLGTLVSIVIIAGGMVFAAGYRVKHLLILAGAGAAAFAILINTASYRLNRIMVYLHPELDPQGIGYQINQALLAAGSGGLWGLGFGRSRQKYHYLPEPAGDSIFAVIAEELGFVRTSIVLTVFALIGYRGMMIARQAPDMFGKLTAVGVSIWIVSQAFINIASTLGVTPMTGIPLPFVSYGGSALVTMMFAAGILLNISRYRTND